MPALNPESDDMPVGCTCNGAFLEPPTQSSKHMLLRTMPGEVRLAAVLHVRHSV